MWGWVYVFGRWGGSLNSMRRVQPCRPVVRHMFLDWYLSQVYIVEIWLLAGRVEAFIFFCFCLLGGRNGAVSVYLQRVNKVQTWKFTSLLLLSVAYIAGYGSQASQSRHYLRSQYILKMQIQVSVDIVAFWVWFTSLDMIVRVLLPRTRSSPEVHFRVWNLDIPRQSRFYLCIWVAFCRFISISPWNVSVKCVQFREVDLCCG